MSSENTTTISVDRRPTKRRLNRLREELDEENPDERVSMDDVVRSLLDDHEELQNAFARVEHLEDEVARLSEELAEEREESGEEAVA